MLDSDWDYIIESVVSKSHKRRNRNHDLIIGKRCIVPDDQRPPYRIGSMIIEPFGNHASSRRFYTTAVQRIDETDDGKLVMETENSIYTFTPIQRSEDSDLSG